MRLSWLLLLLTTWLLPTTLAVRRVTPSPTENATYGVDVSFPMTRPRIEQSLLGDRQALYDELLEGCSRQYNRERCLQSEQKRFERNIHRPHVMNNFTKTGFAKIRAPPELWNLLQTFWQTNGLPANPLQNKNWELESWEYGESTVNHWEAPTYFVSLYNSNLPGGGPALEEAVWEASKSTLEAWTGRKLKGCSLYGIRVYTSESILHTHVDRVPLISSAILNVASDLDEPWPLEVIGHDGIAHNITMVPGDMVLYESHTILHGRPFAMKGRFVANTFVHFEVLADKEGENQPLPYVNYDKVSPEELTTIMEEYHSHWNKKGPVNTQIHTLAGNGRLEEIKAHLEKYGTNRVHAQDPQGWQPIHEAARNGHIETIHYLLEQGADINALTYQGATPTRIAEENQGADSLVVRFLQSKGGLSRAPRAIPLNYPHQLAGNGELERLQQLADEVNPNLLHRPDENGWTPLHEAARMGHADVVEYLVKQGAALNAVTHTGGTPLYYAKQFQGTESLVYHLLKQLGALHAGPDL